MFPETKARETSGLEGNQNLEVTDLPVNSISWLSVHHTFSVSLGRGADLCRFRKGMRKTVVLCLAIAVISVFVTLLLFQYDKFRTVFRRFPNVSSLDLKQNTSTILFYTPYFGGYPWKGVENSEKFTHFKGKPCRVRDCVVTYKKEDFYLSDVVVFYSGDLPSRSQLLDLHHWKPLGQAWVYYVLESPMNNPDKRLYNGIFNWVMTYRRDSDIRHPYGFYLPLTASDSKPSPGIDYSLGKDKFIVWTVSNCGGIRQSYVNKLKEHVKVDIFGACGSAGCSKNVGISSNDCNDVLRTYKFQLAFENTYCVDYVTEKYWGSPLENDIVPIVMGGADYKSIAIPGSYINVLDFSSPKALAEYLLYLDKNNTAYNEYFQWKAKYKLGGCLHGNDLSRHYPWMCELCALARKMTMRNKVYNDLKGYLVEHQCGMYSDDFSKILSQ